MGIIVNDGVRLPDRARRRRGLRGGTPYETHMGRAEAPATQVLAPEVASVVRGMLTQVVEQGTARGLRAAPGAAGRRAARGRRQDRHRRSSLLRRTPRTARSWSRAW